jgi:WD40 repeat protein
VAIAFDAWKAGAVAPTHQEVAVVAPQLVVKLEEVSPGFKGELIHPNKSATLVGLRFSPDGTRLLGGNYPGGVVVLWDVATGKRLTTLKTGSGYRATSDYFFISPDWGRLFGWREKRTFERVEQGGKRMVRWTFDGDVRAWDLTTGQVARTYKHQPPRNIRVMRLSSDGTKFVTSEELPGVYEHGPPGTVSLWDVKTGQYRTMPEGLEAGGIFSPDSRMLALTAIGKDRYARSLNLFDTATGRETLSIPVADKIADAWVSGFSPDGRLMFGTIRVFERAKRWENWRSTFKWWDTATGREVASFPGDLNDVLMNPCLSPDGRTLAALNWREEKKRVFLFSVPEKRLLRTVPIGQNMKGTRLITTLPVFSPDGRWLAVITQALPENVSEDAEAFDVPQPRIVLIEMAAGEVRERLVAPQGFSRSLCFSPDGRMLAVGGYGRVLLWDLTKVQAPADQTRRR